MDTYTNEYKVTYTYMNIDILAQNLILQHTHRHYLHYSIKIALSRVREIFSEY